MFGRVGPDKEEAPRQIEVLEHLPRYVVWFRRGDIEFVSSLRQTIQQAVDTIIHHIFEEPRTL